MENWDDDSKLKYGLLIAILLVAAIWGAIGYVAFHFISKWW